MSRLFFLTLLVGAAIGGQTQARDVAGSVAYRERIALPEGTELLVVLNGAFGQVAEVRIMPDGQVPLPFTLSTEETGPLTLQAALFSGGAQLWLTAEIPVPEGETDVDLGALDLKRHVPFGFSTSMTCGDRLIDIGFAGETARLRDGARVIELQPDPAASGAKFGDGAGNGFWSRGNRALVTLGGEDLPECVPVISSTLPLVARGNEPGWVVTLAHEGVVYSGQDGTRREVPLPAAAETDGGTVFDGGDGLAVRVTDALCRDTMTGMPFPYAVGLTLDGVELLGCGGNPATLLEGRWRLIDFPGMTEPDGADVTLEVLRGGRIAGKAGCNRFMGGMALSGEGLSLEPGGMTMMACPDDLMAFERAFLDRLAEVTQFDFDEAGQLTLLVNGVPGAVFAP